MYFLEKVLIGLILLFPFIDKAIDKYQSSNKNVEYIKIVAILWAYTGILIYLFYTNKLSVVGVSYIVTASWQNLVSLTFLLMAIVYLVITCRQIQRSDQLKLEVAEQFQPFIALMPVTKSQVLIFTLVVSVSAGICEELIFRAYLFHLLDTSIGVLGAIIVSSLIFGLWHLYLGWKEVLRTSMMGGVFCVVYIVTGNIIIPILLHIFIDVYSGLICYFSMQKPTRIATAS